MANDTSPKAGRQTILVVEDEPIVRLVARDILEDAGFDVIEATAGEEAIAVLDERRDIAALFTDVHMPGEPDGLSLARMAPARWPRVKVAVTSGRARPNVGDLPPGTLFVPKPYRPEQLTIDLQRLMSGGSEA